MKPSTSITPDIFLSVKTEEEVLVEVKVDEGWKLVVFNDNHNTFDHVIERLVISCGHEPLQAEQCAMIIHYKGKCIVKTDSFDTLEPICTSLLEADLTASIDP